MDLLWATAIGGLVLTAAATVILRFQGKRLGVAITQGLLISMLVLGTTGGAGWAVAAGGGNWPAYAACSGAIIGLAGVVVDAWARRKIKGWA
jgi:hypothetical protein